MPKIRKLRLNREFRAVYSRGASQVGSVLVTYMKRNRLPGVRIGITASKKIGNAVHRNRARRVILAAWREMAPEVPAGFDLVFVARSRTTQVKMNEVLRVMRRQIEANLQTLQKKKK